MKRIALYVALLLIGILFILKVSPVLAQSIPGMSSQKLSNTKVATTNTTATPSFKIEFGNEQTVFDWPKEAIKCNDSLTANEVNWDIPDSPARALIDASGNVQLYTAYQTNRKETGPNLTQVSQNCTPIMNSDKNSNPRLYDFNEWLVSPYILDSNVIYGLIHTEYHGDQVNPANCNTAGTEPYKKNNCWWNSINLAVSNNNGASFTNALPPPNHNVSNTSIDFNPNNTGGLIGIFAPTNIIKIGNYYYSVVTVRTPPYQLINPDTRRDAYEGHCTMRTDDITNPSSWRYWNGTGWSTPARGIPGTGNPPPFRCANTFIGSDSVYLSTYLGKYLSVNAINAPSALSTTNNIFMQTSSNLTDVDQPEAGFSYKPSNTSFYYALLQPGAETKNFEDIGRSPWLYFSTCGGADCDWAPPGAGHDISLKRVRVRFYTPGVDDNKYDVLDLHFNEGKASKLTLDSSFYGNDGTLFGGSSLGDSKFIHFDGITGYVNVTNSGSLNLGTDVSIAARIKTQQNPAVNTFPIIVQKAGSNTRNYGLFLMNGGKVVFSFTSSPGVFKTGISNKSVFDNNWHDILATYTGSINTLKIYIDGVLDNTVTLTGPLSGGISSGNLTVGNGFNGDIDSVSVYNYPLPAPSGGPTPTATPLGPLAGDLNGDGKVDMTDYNTLKSDFGKTGAPGFIPSDINRNGKVDIFDYTILVGNMTNTSPPPSNSPAPIPTPLTTYKLTRPGMLAAIYTVYTSERDYLLGIKWILGTSTFRIWGTKPDSAMVPVYRMQNAGGDVFFTVSNSDVNYAKSIGYNLDGAAFYAYPSAKTGTVAVHRLVKSYHVYSASDSEITSYKNAGFRDEGIVFYAAGP